MPTKPSPADLHSGCLLDDGSPEAFDRNHWFAGRGDGHLTVREYEDDGRDEADREHWFLGYWSRFIDVYGGLTRSQIEILVKYRRWSGAVRELVYRLCKKDALDDVAETAKMYQQ